LSQKLELLEIVLSTC